jgi:hypothetical protein
MTTEPGFGPGARRAICDRCGARGWLQPNEDRTCGECGGPYRDMARLEGLIDRWFAPAPQHVSEFYPRHLKLVELMWTADGRGRETYAALQPQRVNYWQFVTRATEVVVRGLAEGWIEIDLPTAPTDDDVQYGIRFVDPDRWADELTAAFSDRGPLPERHLEVEGDPDR